ncbi:MAG TPA: LysR family transcriptional regulator [Rhizomicrobium sp.]|nr:LysR family transcriptional regulator [Rhizomicrobium sp.]
MAVNLKHLDLNLLVVFDAVYTARNITRAAEQLSLSQPAVSNALSRLRDLIGDPLFVRGRRGVEPTLKADEIAQTVRDALAMIGHQLAPETLDLSSYRRHFRVVMPDVFEPIMMPPILRTITDQAPHVTIEGLSAFRIDYIKELRDGTVDLVVHIAPPLTPELESIVLGGTDVVLLARRGHPGISGPIDLATIRALPYVVLVPELRNMLTPSTNLMAHGVKRREVYSANKLWAVPMVIERTDLVGILPRWFYREIAKNFDIVAHELPVKLPEQQSAIIWHVRASNDPGNKWLRESLAAAFAAHMQGAAE